LLKIKIPLKYYFLALYVEALGYTLYRFLPNLIFNYVFARESIYGLHLANAVMLILLGILLTLRIKNPIKALLNLAGFIALGELIFNVFYIIRYSDNIRYLFFNNQTDFWYYLALMQLLLILVFLLAYYKVLIPQIGFITLFWLGYLIVWYVSFGFKVTLFFGIGQTEWYNDYTTNLLEILYYHIPIIGLWIHYLAYQLKK